MICWARSKMRIRDRQRPAIRRRLLLWRLPIAVAHGPQPPWIPPYPHRDTQHADAQSVKGARSRSVVFGMLEDANMHGQGMDCAVR